jgi:uncharacterized protein (TIGR03067 family)
MSELSGEYQLASGERDGHPLPADHIHNTVVRFTADTVTVADKDDRQTYKASYRLDTAKTPWRITMTATDAPNAGSVAEGLVEKHGDTVRLIYSHDGKPAPGELLFVMKTGTG